MYRELLSFLIKQYTKMCGKLGEIPGTFSCSKSVALLFAVEGYYLHLQKSEDQAQPKSCRCDTKSSQKVSTILVNSTKIVSNNMLSTNKEIVEGAAMWNNLGLSAGGAWLGGSRVLSGTSRVVNNYVRVSAYS